MPQSEWKDTLGGPDPTSPDLLTPKPEPLLTKTWWQRLTAGFKSIKL